MFRKTMKICSMKYGVKRQMLDMFIKQINTGPNDSYQQISFKMANVSDEERKQFNSVFPIITTDLKDHVKELNVLHDWYTRLLEYNVPTGKRRRGLLTLKSYKLLEDPQRLTADSIRLACTLGWCMELLTGSALMVDDITDNSDMRRGVTCWHKLEDVGRLATNDAFILEHAAYMILRKYFRDHRSYVPLVDLFHRTTYKTLIGQTLDYRISGASKPDLGLFTRHMYRTVALNKAGYFTFQLPVAAAMYLAGIHDDDLHHESGLVSQDLGCWTQVKNDFLDCFGNVSINGATLYGDIREGKCAWPAVVALERANPVQRAVMERCYGRPDEQSVQAVMDVYRELALPTIYANYERDYFNNIRNQIKRMNSSLPEQLFYNIMEIT